MLAVFRVWCRLNGAVHVPMHTCKGDEYECSNSRCMIFFSVLGKLYGRGIIKRNGDRTNGAISEEQRNFKSV